jgi:formylmethanofuran dehydrogenase subunit E
MRSLAEYEQLATVAHGHLCAGQILGLRMAVYGLELLGIEEPEGKDRKRLVTFVEIDRCATDAIPVVTGCRLGKRALKFRDFGKVAATFCDLETGRAVRIAARESSKALAKELFPEIGNRNEQQMQGYRVMQSNDLFSHQWVRVEIGPEEFPGYKGARCVCEECGEGISFERQVVQGDRTLCRSCAGARYYTPL